MILIGSSMPATGLKKIRRVHEIFDIAFSEYSLHFFGFGLFAALLAWCYYKKSSSVILTRSGLLALSFGFFIEVYQFFLPHRSFSLVDLAVDCAGIVVMLALFWGFVMRREASPFP